jgi:serine/threonine protein kinase
MALSLEMFTQYLTDSSLLSAQEVAVLQKSLRPTGAIQFASALVRRKTLTKYQARQILSGKACSLVLGNYVILEKLGQGGMGTVFKAKHRRMDRTVALKVLSPKLTKSPAAVLRFRREVRAAAKLEHPNIVAAFDADESGGTHFLVMQYVDGCDLSKFIKSRGSMTVPLAVRCLEQAACGLQYAHERGIVHRDIKPANLLLSHDNDLKLLDLGLATIADHHGVVDHGLTDTTAIIGSVDYMAPEQGVNTKRADARSDIYSLGCTFFYLLTGRIPFSGETAVEKILAHRDQPTPDLGRLRPDLPTPLLQVFQRMVAKKSADRYQTMGEVLTDLRAVGDADATIIDPAFGAAPFDPALQKFFETQEAKNAEQPELVVKVMQSEPLAKAVRPSTTNTASIDGDSLITRRHAKIKTIPAPAGNRPPGGGRTWVSAAIGGPGRLLLCGIVIMAIASTFGTTMKNIRDGGAKNVQDVPEPPPPVNSITARGPVNFVVERAAAEWGLSVGGTLVLVNNKGAKQYPRDGKLLDGNWALESMALDACSEVHHDDLERLLGCRQLQSLSLNATSIDNLSLEIIGGLTDLVHLHLMKTSVTDTGLKRLVGLKNLDTLDLSFTKVSDEGMNTVAELTNLRYLSLGETAVGDPGLATLRTLKQLEEISLGVAVSDRGFRHLASFPNLKRLGLKTHQLTKLSVTHLQSLPQLENLDITGVTDADVVLLKSLIRIKELSLKLNQLTAQGLKVLEELPHVEFLLLANNPQITDANLLPLTRMIGLKQLYLSSSSVTPAGINAFRQARPDVYLNIDEADYPAATNIP